MSAAMLAAISGVALWPETAAAVPVVEGNGTQTGPAEHTYPLPPADGVTIDRDTQVILVRFHRKHPTVAEWPRSIRGGTAMSCARIGPFGVALSLFCAWASLSQAGPRESSPPTTAEKITPPPPSRPVSELAEELNSPTASVRAEAARELAGASRLPEKIWGALNRLCRDDPDRAVRLAAERARHLLVIHGVRATIPDAYDEGPRPIKMEHPRYPRKALHRRITGIVRVLVLVNEQGDVEDAEIIESIPELDDAALRCVRDWKFEPATKNGEPTPTYAVAPISFTVTTNVFGYY